LLWEAERTGGFSQQLQFGKLIESCEISLGESTSQEPTDGSS